MSIDNMFDTFARGVFYSTRQEAQEKGICIECKEPALPKCHSVAGLREYRISSLCEECFDDIFSE